MSCSSARSAAFWHLGRVPPGFVFGALGGLAVGIVAAVRAVRIAKPAGPVGPRHRDAVAAFAVLAGASVVVVSISFAFDPKWTRYVLRRLEHDLPVPVLLPVLTVIAAVALTHGLSGSRDHLPHRSQPAWAWLPRGDGRQGGRRRPGRRPGCLGGPALRGGALSILGGGAVVVLALVVGLNRWLSAVHDARSPQLIAPLQNSDTPSGRHGLETSACPPSPNAVTPVRFGTSTGRNAG